MVILVPLMIASFRMKGFAVLRAQLSMAEVKQEEKMREFECLFSRCFWISNGSSN
jgi:hypothetical protein